VEVAQKLSETLAGEGIPAGIGVHWGVAFFGAMGTAEGLTDISAIGDEVNVAARIASKAAAGEVVVSEQALQKAGLDGSDLPGKSWEVRSLELQGIREPVAVRVISGRGG